MRGWAEIARAVHYMAGDGRLATPGHGQRELHLHVIADPTMADHAPRQVIIASP